MKNWGGLILCFLLSAAIWLVFNVSQTYSQIVNVPVLVSSNIPGHSLTSSRNITVAVRCNAGGYDLIRLNSIKEAIPVFIDASSIKQVEGDTYELPPANVYKYSEQIFGSNVKVESVLSENMILTFSTENFVKVPVILSTRLVYHRQYMSPAPATTIPDSVLVYGTPESLRDVEAIETELVTQNDLRKSVHGNIRLKEPGGLRTSISEVEYNIPVCRYVDISATKDVKIKNLPSEVSMIIQPTKAKVKLRCYFPVDKNPVSDLQLYVDYKDYESSLNGNCRIIADGVSDNIITLETEPEFCKCIQTVQ